MRQLHLRALAAALLIGAAGCIIHSTSPAPAPAPVVGDLGPAANGKPLRQAAAGSHRRVGTALMSGRLGDARARKLAAQEFDSLTPENEMKWYAVEPRPGGFSFAAGDRLVAFAAENGMRMRGHTLVWHNQLAPWVKTLAPQALREATARHVREVVGHWKGKIAAWDVVNEALAQDRSGELRADSPFAALGPAYIDEAFRVAHEVDPAAQLFYNDYDIEGEGTPKSDAAFALCQRLRQAGVPIDGIGFQMHVDPRHWPPADSIRRNMERFAALGLTVEITEMDVPVGEIPGTIDDKLRAQSAIAHDIVAACVAVEKCAAVTFWGLTDPDSWLSSAEWGPTRGRLPHYPLLFNGNYQAKPVVGGVIEALGGR